MNRAENNNADYLLRLCRQDGEKFRCIHGNLTKEDFDKIVEILNISEEEWE